ncbi:FAD-dependent monooxygenase [Neisseriaceae bacterium ESL0693]|nr:FAD-dependent monooxygenase [Neisseriaceae bacterium ESL0693]
MIIQTKIMHPLSHHQVAIIGAGPVGMLLALQLKQQGRQVLLIEARAAQRPSGDQRTLALSYHSVAALRAAGVPIQDDMLSRITQVHVSRQGHLGRVLLRAEELALPYLGASIDYACLLRLCEAALQTAGVPVLWQSPVTQIHTLDHMATVHYQHQGQPQTLTAQWVVLAEGGQLAASLPGIRVRSHDYRQKALVNTIAFDKSNQGIAYERFTPQGPLALLPYGDDFRLVWTCSLAEAEQRLNLTQEQLSEQLRLIMGDRLGAVRSMGTAATFPLQLRQLNRVYSHRVVCIGNAAQTMHPVAAQGLNLGIRDAETLAAVFAAADVSQLADGRLARAYARQRYHDTRSVVGFTHALIQWFDGAGTVMQWGQGMGMGLLGALTPLRQRFTRHLVFGLPAR